ncbi:MAG: hypothetical protein Q9M97_02730 [Candidatus Gracilibacteria bacterium]|nr:hypothetical protein [Candidatus Gracilibacteria bacterium]
MAILFNPGVGGEGQSKINIKSTLVNTKNNLLGNINAVKKAKISEIDTKINEKVVILSESIKNFDTKINRLESFIKNKTISEDFSVENINLGITVEEKNLEILEQNLETAISSKDEKLSDAQNNIKQKKDLFDIKLNEVLNNIIPMFYIGNENDINYNTIKKGDLLDIFGIKNSILTNELLTKIRDYQNNKDTLTLLLKNMKI